MEAERIKSILQYVKSYEDTLGFNYGIFEILEGDIKSHIENAMAKQFSTRTLEVAKKRICPINLYRKIVKKLSKCYAEGITRKANNNNNQKLVDDYSRELKLNQLMTSADRSLNSYRSVNLELFYSENEKELKARVDPAFQCIAYSDDPIDPMRVTAIIKILDHVDKNGKEVKKYWIYTEDEFIPVDGEGKLIKADMSETEGVNVFGEMPIIYKSASENLLVPIPDYDLYTMSILLPLLYTDLNYVSMFSAHGVIYGIDLDVINQPYAPDIIWNLQSKIEGKSPTVGTLNPPNNVAQILELLKNEMADWMESRDIKSVGIGNMQANSSNVASGISLMIREMDTTNLIKENQSIFLDIEHEFWETLARIHNYLVSTGRIIGMGMFTDDFEVAVEFPSIKVIEDRSTTVNVLASEVNNKFNSRRNAIKELKPYLTEKEIDALILEIDTEGTKAQQLAMSTSKNYGTNNKDQDTQGI